MPSEPIRPRYRTQRSPYAQTSMEASVPVPAKGTKPGVAVPVSAPNPMAPSGPAPIPFEYDERRPAAEDARVNALAYGANMTAANQMLAPKDRTVTIGGGPKTAYGGKGPVPAGSYRPAPMPKVEDKTPAQAAPQQAAASPVMPAATASYINQGLSKSVHDPAVTNPKPPIPGQFSTATAVPAAPARMVSDPTKTYDQTTGEVRDLRPGEERYANPPEKLPGLDLDKNNWIKLAPGDQVHNWATDTDATVTNETAPEDRKYTFSQMKGVAPGTATTTVTSPARIEQEKEARSWAKLAQDARNPNIETNIRDKWASDAAQERIIDQAMAAPSTKLPPEWDAHVKTLTAENKKLRDLLLKDRKLPPPIIQPDGSTSKPGYSAE